MYVGEIGVQLQAPTGQASGFLTGKTAVLKIGPQGSATPSATLTCTPSSDGTTALYTTLGTEFTSSGQWYVDLEVSQSTTLLLKSRVIITVTQAY